MTTKKAITLGILTTALITMLFLGIKEKPFKTTTPNANKQRTTEVKAESQTLTDLTNTTWYFNETLNNLTPNGRDIVNEVGQQWTEYWPITFISNSTTYYEFNFVRGVSIYMAYRGPSSADAYTYTNNTWENNIYRKIKIVGGQNTTNTKLINWLFDNATYISINTLENTSWQLNYEITDMPTNEYNINFYCNGLNFDGLKLGYQFDITDNAITYGNTSQRCYYHNGTWSYYTPYSKILITDGQDIENYLLIAWLLKNGKQFTTFNTVLNTKWTFIDNPRSEYENLTYDVQFTSYNKPCQTIKAGYTTNNIQNQIAYGFQTSNAQPYTINTVYDGSQWLNTKWQTIIIVNGNDLENLSFISFLISNAEGTSYTPIPTWNGDAYDIEDGNFTSLQSLMLQILTMPFTFISQAFNVTLWPNTAWEFNLSNFILSIIAIASILFIIRLFTSGFTVIGNYTSNQESKRVNRDLRRSQTKLNQAKTEKIKKDN